VNLQQLWGYKVEEKLQLGVREQKWLNTTGIVSDLLSMHKVYLRTAAEMFLCSVLIGETATVSCSRVSVILVIQ
jgi:hypothetical protein